MHFLTALVFAAALFLSTFAVTHLYDYFRPRDTVYPSSESPHGWLTVCAALAWGLFYYLAAR